MANATTAHAAIVQPDERRREPGPLPVLWSSVPVVVAVLRWSAAGPLAVPGLAWSAVAVVGGSAGGSAATGVVTGSGADGFNAAGAVVRRPGEEGSIIMAEEVVCAGETDGSVAAKSPDRRKTQRIPRRAW